MAAWQIILVYMIAGYAFVAPKETSDFHWNQVHYHGGFFMYPMPLWLWVLLWIIWLPLVLLKVYYIKFKL